MVELDGFFESVFIPQYTDIVKECGAVECCNKDDLNKIFADKVECHFIRSQTTCFSGVNDFSGLDRHKQAACICVSILDISPLMPSDKLKKAMPLGFYYPTEALAAMCGFMLVHYSIADVCNPDSRDNNSLSSQICKEFGDRMRKMTPSFPNQINDHKGYMSNFISLLHNERRNAACLLKKENGDLCDYRCRCLSVSSCPMTAPYNYLTLSMLFYHYEVNMREKCRAEIHGQIDKILLGENSQLFDR
jgi:hypothetical protein